MRHFIQVILSVLPLLFFFTMSLRDDTTLYAFSLTLRQKLGVLRPSLPSLNRIAVIDAGLSTTHWYMKTSPLKSVLFRKTPLRKRIDYANGHATAVVSMIRHVSPSARVVCYNTESFEDLTKTVDLLVKDPSVKIVNISKGYSRFDRCHADLWRLAEAGKIVICSAGNAVDQKVDPRIVARLVQSPRAHGRILLVGAGYERADRSYALCKFSVRPNQSRAHYVVAPGENLTAAVCNKQSHYLPSVSALSGTSFAAPIVAGLIHHHLAFNDSARPILRHLKQRQQTLGAVCVNHQPHHVKNASD